MFDLDCRDLDSTLRSLAALAGIEGGGAVVAEALQAYDETRLQSHDEAPDRRLVPEIFEQLGADPNALALRGVHCFHVTRAADPSSLWTRGILPLDQMIESLWSQLYGVVADERSPDEWRAFRESVEAGGGGHSGWLYRSKTGHRIHFGPYAFFVREVLLSPDSTNHDYLACPEIVRDLAGCYQSAYGTDLERRFSDETKACIVAFRDTRASAEAVIAATCFAFNGVRGRPPTRDSMGGPPIDGEAVPAASIVSVEVVERVPGDEVRYVATATVPRPS